MSKQLGPGRTVPVALGNTRWNKSRYLTMWALPFPYGPLCRIMRIGTQKSALGLPASPGRAAGLLTISRGRSGTPAPMKSGQARQANCLADILAEVAGAV